VPEELDILYLPFGLSYAFDAATQRKAAIGCVHHTQL
jgi:hypothetical protein